MEKKNFIITTTRFNNDTLNQKTNWCKSNRFNGSIYNTPIKLSPKIPTCSPIIVIEMNNDTNKITGFGLIKNKLDYNYYRIYNTINYNRFTYKSNYYLNTDDIDLNFNNIILAIEKILFTGKTHLKRGQGITHFPDKFNFNKDLNTQLISHSFKNLSFFFRHIFLERFKKISF